MASELEGALDMGLLGGFLEVCPDAVRDDSVLSIPTFLEGVGVDAFKYEVGAFPSRPFKSAASFCNAGSVLG